MEAKVIIVTVVKSNKSENNVWMVAITGEEQGQAYCKSAYKAMRLCVPQGALRGNSSAKGSCS